MRRVNKQRSALAVLLMVGSWACSPDQGERSTVPPSSAGSSSSEIAADRSIESLLLVDEGPLGNPQDCVEEFDPLRDYFSAKTHPRHAKGFSVEYFGHYKKVSLKRSGGDESTMILLLCGTPLPAGLDNQPMIEIPVRSVVTTSSTELPHLVQLGVLDRLLAHDNFDYVSSPEVRRQVEAGELAEVGSGSQLDLERLVDLDPELLLIDSVGDPAFQLRGKLRDLDIPVAMIPSYLETNALGRAEWMLYTALFFNREDRAERLLTRVFDAYAELAQGGRAASDRPTALSSGPVGDVWYVPGGESYMARLLRDAGAEYLWADDPSSGSLALDIESVYERALEADVWLHPSNWSSLTEIRRIDGRFADLQAFREGRVYGNDARLNAAGGNDYWESGTARPDLVLRDLLLIFQPELAGNHELLFHCRLEEKGGGG